jgi:hypothetical protein
MKLFWTIFWAVLAAQLAFWLLKAGTQALLDVILERWADRRTSRPYRPRSSGNRQGERNWERISREAGYRSQSM